MTTVGTLIRDALSVRPRTASPRTAAAQIIETGNRFDIAAALNDASTRWYKDAHLWARTNGTLASSLRYLGSRSAGIQWEAQIRENGQWVKDPNPYCEFFAESLVTLDTPATVEQLGAVGVTYLVVAKDDNYGLSWTTYSASELQWFGGRESGPLIQRSRLEPPKPLWTAETPVKDRPAVCRIWRPDLEWSGEAWSPVAAVLDHLEALYLMVLAEKALDTSRLAGAGILFLPNEIAYPDMLGTGEARDITKSPTFRRIVRAITEPITDRSSVDASVPVVLTGPADTGDKIKHLVLERKDDPNAFSIRRESHLREIARAMDLPAGRVMNTDDQAKFANSSSITDEVVDVYLPRFTTLIATGITERVYRPVLASWDVPDVAKRRIWPDASALQTQEDRTDEALRLREQGLVSRKGAAKMANVPDEFFMADGSTEYQSWLGELRLRGQAPQPVAPIALPSDYGALPPATASVGTFAPPNLAAKVAALEADAAVIVAAAKKKAPKSVGAQLAQLGDQAIDTDTKINLADFEVKGKYPFDGLGIPRKDMPQLDGDNKTKFLTALADEDVTVDETGLVDPLTLSATQDQLSARKAREMSLADNTDDLLAEPIIVASDGHVLDGHHRWVAAIMLDRQIPVTTVGLPIEDLLERANEFSGRKKAFTAAATPDPKPVSSPWATIAAQLNAIDDALAEGLTAAAEHALATALSAAGRRVTPKVSAAVRATIVEVPAGARCAALGHAVVAATGLSEDDLLRNAVDDLEPVADRLIESAQTRAASVLGVAPAAAVLASWRHTAVKRLASQLTDLARVRLFDPNPKIDERGEQPIVVRTVPGAVIRSTMGEAGGEQIGTDMLPLGRTATGSGMLKPALATADAPKAVWTWHHGPTSRPFPPHLALDGARMASTDDERLQNTDPSTRWLGFRQLSPSDHPGCGCSLVLSWE